MYNVMRLLLDVLLILLKLREVKYTALPSPPKREPDVVSDFVRKANVHANYTLSPDEAKALWRMQLNEHVSKEKHRPGRSTRSSLLTDCTPTPSMLGV